MLGASVDGPTLGASVGCSMLVASVGGPSLATSSFDDDGSVSEDAELLDVVSISDRWKGPGTSRPPRYDHLGAAVGPAGVRGGVVVSVHGAVLLHAVCAVGRLVSRRLRE